MVNAELLAKLKPNAVLLNTSRGSLVNEQDLLAHLESHPDFWYGTDVFVGEPSVKEGPFDHPLAKHPRVYGTHHIGASTKQAESAIGEEAVRIIKKFVASGGVDNENCVNKEREDPKLHKLSIRHFDKVGVLAHLFKVLADHGWNVQELENIVFKQREACVANIRFTGDISSIEKAIADIKLNENVIDITY